MPPARTTRADLDKAIVRQPAAKALEFTDPPRKYGEVVPRFETPHSNGPTSARRPGARDAASGYRRIAWLLLTLVILPSALLIAAGVVLLAVGAKRDSNLVLGILVVVMCGVLAAGATLVWVFLAKEQGLSQLQTDFVSKVSHELKTPLTSIRMFVETLKLKRATDPAQVDACIDLLSKETERLTERIDQLLEWGRMEAGRKVYDLRSEDVSEVVREAVAGFVPLNLQGDADLSLDVDDNVPQALVDRGALIEGVQNLLSNAYKYGGSPRKIAVSVSASPDRGEVWVSVTDNGQGIPKYEHKRIFQKFYRRDDRLSRMAEGSGLGLAILAHVAKGHGGRVRVESDEGKGSTFVLELPAEPSLPGASQMIN